MYTKCRDITVRFDLLSFLIYILFCTWVNFIRLHHKLKNMSEITKRIVPSEKMKTVGFSAVLSLVFFAMMAMPAFAQAGSSIDICGTQFQQTLKMVINLLIIVGIVGSALVALYQHVMYSTNRDGSKSTRNTAIAGIILIPLLTYALQAFITNILGYSNLGCIFPP